ncbi:MAG: hypothetical protein ACRDZZ_00585 [Ilumatobacteraceae bacterium]
MLPPPAGSEPGGEPVRRSWWKRRWLKLPVWTWAVIGVLVAAGIGGAVSGDDEAERVATAPPPSVDDASDTTSAPADATAVPPTEPTDAVDPTTTVAPTRVPPTTTVAPTTTTVATTTTTTEPPLEVIGSGTYIVNPAEGTEVASGEIRPGAYRVAGYWAALDAVGEIIDNDGVYGPGELTLMVVPGDASFVEISGEAISIWDLPSYPVLSLSAVPEGGTYLVGADIEVGTYRVSDPDYAYAARLDSTLEIISNEGNAGSVIIVVQPGDFALSYSGGLERVS